MPVEVPKEIKIPVPQPYKVPIEIPHPYPVEVVKQVEIPIEKPEPYVVEKHVSIFFSSSNIFFYYASYATYNKCGNRINAFNMYSIFLNLFILFFSTIGKF